MPETDPPRGTRRPPVGLLRAILVLFFRYVIARLRRRRLAITVESHCVETGEVYSGSYVGGKLVNWHYEPPETDAGMLAIDQAMTEEDVRAHDVLQGGRECRVCGCTDNSPCVDGCSWVGPNLCSACYEPEAHSETVQVRPPPRDGFETQQDNPLFP